MSDEMVINTLLGVALGGLSWWVRTLWAMLQSVQRELADHKVHLAEQYMPRPELDRNLQRIFDELTQIRKALRHE